jgi:NDP-sugar pyrophosphorylase family protein
MRELTESIPKPMVVVRGKPVLQIIVEGLRQSGIKELLIIVGYRQAVVRDHFRNPNMLCGTDYSGWHWPSRQFGAAILRQRSISS